MLKQHTSLQSQQVRLQHKLSADCFIAFQPNKHSHLFDALEALYREGLLQHRKDFATWTQELSRQILFLAHAGKYSHRAVYQTLKSLPKKIGKKSIHPASHKGHLEIGNQQTRMRH